MKGSSTPPAPSALVPKGGGGAAEEPEAVRAGAAHQERVAPASRVGRRDGVTLWFGTWTLPPLCPIVFTRSSLGGTNLSRLFLFDVQSCISFSLSD